MLSNWNMVVDIMEGPGGTDSAEISLLATDPSLNEQLSITLFRPEITPETFALPGSYQVTDGAEGSETSIALSSDSRNLVTETGRVEVTSHEAGKVTGSLLARVTPEGSADPLEVRGDFEGLVHIACNALASLEADAPVGTSLDGDAGPVWTSVGIDDPFCAQYL
jgi:hypothetical protein